MSPTTYKMVRGTQTHLKSFVVNVFLVAELRVGDIKDNGFNCVQKY